MAKKKETTMSQMTSLVIAEKAWANVKVLVASVAVTAIKAQAPTGSGSNTSPRIVVTNMDRSVHP